MPKSVTLDGVKFVVRDAVFESMSGLGQKVRIAVDISDAVNVPFTLLKKLFDLANPPSPDKLKDIELDFWVDDAMTDILVAFGFRGWVSLFRISDVVDPDSTTPATPILELEITPVVNVTTPNELVITISG